MKEFCQIPPQTLWHQLLDKRMTFLNLSGIKRKHIGAEANFTSAYATGFQWLTDDSLDMLVAKINQFAFLQITEKLALVYSFT